MIQISSQKFHFAYLHLKVEGLKKKSTKKKFCSFGVLRKHDLIHSQFYQEALPGVGSPLPFGPEVKREARAFSRQGFIDIRKRPQSPCCPEKCNTPHVIHQKRQQNK